MTASDFRRTLMLFLLLALACGVAPAQYTAIYALNANVDGDAPGQPDVLAQGTDGNLYGTLPSGQLMSAGSFFQDVLGKFPTFSPAAGNGSTIPDTGLRNAESGYLLAVDGNLYGAAPLTSTGPGALIKVTGGTAAVVFPFTPASNGTTPHAPPVMGMDRNLYGIACNSSSTAFVYQVITSTAPWSAGWTKQVPSCSRAALFLADDGNLYGTYPNNSFPGGVPTQGGFGGVFAINYAGSILWTYDMNPGAGDGQNPQGGVIQAADGKLYGTNSGNAGSVSVGNVFSIALNGAASSYKVIHSFQNADGISPQGGLVQGSDGMLYGMCTDQGALGMFIPLGTVAKGTIFKVALDGSNFTRLFTFTRNTNNGGQGSGSDPKSTPLLHTSGDLYGMTHSGGSSTNGANGGQTGGYDDGGELFKYHTGMTPFVNTVTRRYGRAGHFVNLIGQGFTHTTSVKFGGTEVAWGTKGAVDIWSDTFMTVQVPNFAHTGPITVTETNGAQTTLSTTYNFRICSAFMNCP